MVRLIETIGREAAQLIMVLNKSDQASPNQLHEVSHFTSSVIAQRLSRKIGQIC